MQAAKAKTPCIIFIDEIDAIGSNRRSWENHSRKTLNQMLTEMDGFEENSGVIVIAATNLPDVLDPALTRPGRFDRRVTINTPDVKGRQACPPLPFLPGPVWCCTLQHVRAQHAAPFDSAASCGHCMARHIQTAGAAAPSAHSRRPYVYAGVHGQLRDSIRAPHRAV